MRFLVDAQLPPALAGWLVSRGHEAQHVLEIFEASAPDTVIAGASRESGSVVISKDADFLQLQVDGMPPVIWVRLGNSTNRVLLGLFEAEWPRVADALGRGEAVVELP